MNVPVCFRWNQPARPGKHVRPFTADSPETLLSIGTTELMVFAVFRPLPLRLQRLRVCEGDQGHASGRRLEWADLAVEDWPPDVLLCEERLSSRREEFWANACLFLVMRR